MTSPDSPTPDWVTSFPDTATPDWATDVPATSAVHPKETGGLTRPLTNQQLAKIGKQLLEQFLKQIVLALQGFFHPNGGTSLAQLMKWAQELAAELASMRSLTDWMAFTGSNLVLDPHFDSLINFTRFPVAPAQICDYTTDVHHSGLKSWRWWHFPAMDSGLILAPTTHVDYFSVGASESYFVEAWIRPDSGNSMATGSIRIGATVSDSGEFLEDTDIYLDFPLNGPDVVRGQWNKINHTVEIPTGYDTAKFWVKSTAATAADSIFAVDDVIVRENTSGVKAEIQPHWPTAPSSCAHGPDRISLCPRRSPTRWSTGSRSTPTSSTDTPAESRRRSTPGSSRGSGRRKRAPRAGCTWHRR